MRLLLAGILAFLPLTVQAESPGDRSTNETDQNQITTPSTPGNGDDSDKMLSELWPYGNPYSPESATNFEPLTSASAYDPNRLDTHPQAPDWLNDPFGSHGGLYSPDLPTDRYGTGHSYSPGNPMHPYGRDVRVPGR
jgi:hypothetical protein